MSQGQAAPQSHQQAVPPRTAPAYRARPKSGAAAAARPPQRRTIANYQTVVSVSEVFSFVRVSHSSAFPPLRFARRHHHIGATTRNKHSWPAGVV